VSSSSKSIGSDYVQRNKCEKLLEIFVSTTGKDIMTKTVQYLLVMIYALFIRTFCMAKENNRPFVSTILLRILCPKLYPTDPFFHHSLLIYYRKFSKYQKQVNSPRNNFENDPLSSIQYNFFTRLFVLRHEIPVQPVRSYIYQKLAPQIQ